MTREERLYAMRGAELIIEAEKLGVKVAHKGNSLKESKDKAVQKILAAEAANEENLESVDALEEKRIAEDATIDVPVVDLKSEMECGESDKEVAENAEEVEKKAKKECKTRRTKKTFEQLVADIPALANVHFIASAKGAVHVKIGTDKRRLFGYTGTGIVVGDKRYVEGLEYEAKNYGFCLAPTAENMLALFANYMAINAAE